MSDDTQDKPLQPDAKSDAKPEKPTKADTKIANLTSQLADARELISQLQTAQAASASAVEVANISEQRALAKHGVESVFIAWDDQLRSGHVVNLADLRKIRSEVLAALAKALG